MQQAATCNERTWLARRLVAEATTDADKRVRRLWVTLSSSLWFIPSAIVTVALMLAVGLVEASAMLGDDALAQWPRLFGAGAAGARGVLSTIAGSIITVAGVVFSITIAALALASAQYTPRVLRTFMADRANQLVLGSFVGIYVYCLVVLRTIRGGDEGAFVPSIAVLGAVVLALVGVGVLIFFVHHIATALQAATILQRVRVATEAAIRELFPDPGTDGAEPPSERQDGASRWHAVVSTRTGYIQAVDADGLAQVARQWNGSIRMENGAGDFVVAGDAIACFAPGDSVAPARRSDEELRDRVTSMFAIAAHRTVEHDPAFGILQIVDIALKALSPGINDTTTAVSCVDHLGGILAELGPRRIASRVRATDHTPRLIERGPTYESLLALALDDVRRSASSNVSVLIRLCRAISVAARHTPDPGRRRLLTMHLGLVEAAARRGVPEEHDRRMVEARAREARGWLDLAYSSCGDAEPGGIAH